MVALAVALGVVRDAGVDAAVGARHLLQHEALVRDDHLLRDVVAQLATLQHAGFCLQSFIPFTLSKETNANYRCVNFSSAENAKKETYVRL